MTDQTPIEPDDNQWGVLLLAHGAPGQLEDIPEFLLHVRGGRKLSEAAVQQVIHRYALIGGGSPLLELTNRQAEALVKALGQTNSLKRAWRVYVGMRNWKPFIPDVVRRLSEDGVERVVAVCLAPQNSRTSVGLYRKSVQETARKIAPHLKVEFVESWHDHPFLIAAFREKVTLALARAQAEARKSVPVIFTAHSVPERTMADGDPYAKQVRETAALVAETMGLKDWRLAFQSQGMTEEPWIGPTVESEIDLLAEAGHRHVLIAPVGFVSDHLEILYDIDVAFRDYGKTKGVTVLRSESLNDSPLFIEVLASIVRQAADRSGWTAGPNQNADCCEQSTGNTGRQVRAQNRRHSRPCHH
jgi:ferrochelatase